MIGKSRTRLLPIGLRSCRVDLYVLRIAWVVVLSAFAGGPCQGAEWIRGAVRINSDVSAGRTSILEIAQIAQEKRLDYLVLTDQFLVRGEFGMPPLRNLLRYHRSRRSVKTFGIRDYLDNIRRSQEAFPDIIHVPGVDVAPHYYWDGAPWSPPFTGYRWSEQLTVIGGFDADFYRGLPVIHNRSFGIGEPAMLLLKLLPLVLCLPGLYIVHLGITRYEDNQGNRYAIYEKPRIFIGFVLCVAGLLWTVNNQPFMSGTSFNQYADHGVAPFQALIDYVEGQDQLCFWSAPEAEMKVDYGRVKLHTRPYFSDVEATMRHNGFAALYGDRSTAHEPGRGWDQMLRAYCEGKRRVRPVAIGEVDYHTDRELDAIVTVVAVSAKSVDAVKASLAAGRSYALSGGCARGFEIVTATVGDGESSAGIGESLRTDRSSVVFNLVWRWRSGAAPGSPAQGKFRLIANGQEVELAAVSGTSGSVQIPVDMNTDSVQYIRFLIDYPNGRVVANPVFIHRLTEKDRTHGP